jgi:hypothetical protein
MIPRRQENRKRRRLVPIHSAIADLIDILARNADSDAYLIHNAGINHRLTIPDVGTRLHHLSTGGDPQKGKDWNGYASSPAWLRHRRMPDAAPIAVCF